MTAVSPSLPSSPAPAALSAFLRGVERRAWVVAELYCGDATQAQSALLSTLQQFQQHAGTQLMAAWPVYFWTRLRASLQAQPVAGRWQRDCMALASMAPPDRLAMLLRIGAGLDEPMAADVLAITEDDYREGLSRACPRDEHGRPDALGWRSLAEAVQARIRELGGEQLQRLAQLRNAAESGLSRQPDPVAALNDGRAEIRPSPARRRQRQRKSWSWPRWQLPSLSLPSVQLPRWGLPTGLCVLVLRVLGGWWWSQRGPELPPEPVSAALPGALHVSDAAPVLVEELPAADAPESTNARASMSAEDAAMLADPELRLASKADFLAWYAAGGPLPVDESSLRPDKPASASEPLETLDDEN